MVFKTQFDPHERVYCNHGTRIHTTYGGHYDEKGRVVLEETGKENTYDKIQSYAESVDIHVIMKRFVNGDVNALSERQGFYGDVLGFPKTYAEFLNQRIDMERMFNSLPVEIREKFNHSFTEFLAASNDDDFLDKLGVQRQPDPVPAVPAEPAVEGGKTE